jgi:hypothetical protein
MTGRAGSAGCVGSDCAGPATGFVGCWVDGAGWVGLGEEVGAVEVVVVGTGEPDVLAGGVEVAVLLGGDPNNPLASGMPAMITPRMVKKPTISALPSPRQILWPSGFVSVVSAAVDLGGFASTGSDGFSPVGFDPVMITSVEQMS